MKRIFSGTTAAIVGLALVSTAQGGVGYNNGFLPAGFDTQGPEFYILYNGSSANFVTAASLGINGGVDQGPYDGSDDTYIGVVNTSTASVLNSVYLTSTSLNPIFAFDGDGITAYGVPGNPLDTSSSSSEDQGPGVLFSGIAPNLNSGTVNFTGGLAPGQTAYFSLESSVGGVLGSGGGFAVGAPDAGSSIALLGGALAGIGVLRRKFKS
jgi:hypothetical protein